jgi:type IV pilus assembly protein PilQ
MSCRKQRKGSVFIVAGFYFLFHSWAQAAVTITGVNFNGAVNPSEISIEADGPIVFDKQESAEDKQVILEIKGATINDLASKTIDTSSFDSNISMISPYQVQGQSEIVRVVIQLRGPGTADVIPGQNSLKITIPNPKDSSSSAATSQTPKSPLDEFTQNKETQKFSGKPVTLQIRDGDVEDVLRLIGEASGFNVIIGDDVKGKVTLSLVDVPWDQALDVVLQTMHLGADRSNNILRVGTLTNLTAEKSAELSASKAAQAAMPRITRVFPVSYARLSDLQGLLAKFASGGASTGSSGGSLGSTGGGGSAGSLDSSIVQLDERTNSIVVRDTMENLDRMRKLIEILDTQTPQVMIEAKVIEATEGFSKSLTGSLGFGGTGDTSAFGSFAGANPLDPLIGTPGVFSAGSAITSLSNAAGSLNGTFGLSPSVSFLPGISRLNAVLSWGESENQLKIVSSPKTVVLNKEKANIIEGTPVLVPGTTTQNGITVPANTVQSANVSLEVKPIVTNDGSILMELSVSKDVPVNLGSGLGGIGTRNIKTTVLVESGSTLVIGGIYTMQTDHTSSGFPILRKLPIIGALFGSENESTNRSELFIFITPRILNARESGLTS